MRRFTTCAIAAAAAIGASSVASAEPGIVVVTGTVSAQDKDIVAKAVSTTAHGAGWDVVGKPPGAKDLSALSECVHKADAKCASRALHDPSLQRVAVVNIEQQQSSTGVPQLVLTARMINLGAGLFVTSQRFCEHCTDDTLATSSSDLAQDLLNRLALAAGRSVLSVKSIPRGAKFSVDGVIAGATDAVIDVVPGAHTVVVEIDGYDRDTETVEAAEGKTAEVSVTLHQHDAQAVVKPVDAHVQGGSSGSSSTPPIVPPPKTIETDTPSRTLPHVLVVGGVLTMVAGGVTLALNQSADADPNKNQSPHYYDTTGPGIALLAAGAVATGLGGYLWWRSSKPHPTVVAVPIPGGSLIGVSGSF